MSTHIISDPVDILVNLVGAEDGEDFAAWKHQLIRVGSQEREVHADSDAKRGVGRIANRYVFDA